MASSKAGQCKGLTVALCIVAPIISCESGSQEVKNKDIIIMSIIQGIIYHNITHVDGSFCLLIVVDLSRYKLPSTEYSS